MTIGRLMLVQAVASAAVLQSTAKSPGTLPGDGDLSHSPPLSPSAGWSTSSRAAAIGVRPVQRRNLDPTQTLAR
jgi:hypothetical protein